MADELPDLVAGTEWVSRTFGRELDPVLVVDDGDRFAVHTRSILTHVDPADLDRFESLPDFSHLDIPVTGPIAVRGARIGDVLRIDIHEVRIADLGAMVTIKGRGGFSEPLGPAGKLLPIVGDKVMFDDIALPVEPMIGKIGVAAPGDPHCSTVGPHGGNLDCTRIGPGTTLYLPVLTDEAHLFVGDLHARQGDGEASLTGVEVEGTVIATCRIVRGWGLQRPLAVTAGFTVTIGDGDDLDEAVQVALDDMVQLVRDQRDCSYEEAAMFLSVAADVGVCQVVNARKSARVSVPLDWLPLQLPPSAQRNEV